MVTSGTYGKAMLYGGEGRLAALGGGLLKYAVKHGWTLQAWAVFPNHYHFIASSPGTGGATLPGFLRELHSRSARWLNRQDQTPGRRVWHNIWETHLVALVAEHYPWCSAGWFVKTATPAFRKMVYGFKTDPLQVEDGF